MKIPCEVVEDLVSGLGPHERAGVLVPGLDPGGDVGLKIGNVGAVRSSAWICDFSSTHSTSAACGGSRYNPTTSRTLSMNCGSVDSFQVSTRCGFKPNARQIREIAVCDIPVARAID